MKKWFSATIIIPENILYVVILHVPYILFSFAVLELAIFRTHAFIRGRLSNTPQSSCDEYNSHKTRSESKDSVNIINNMRSWRIEIAILLACALQTSMVIFISILEIAKYPFPTHDMLSFSPYAVSFTSQAFHIGYLHEVGCMRGGVDTLRITSPIHKAFVCISTFIIIITLTTPVILGETEFYSFAFFIVFPSIISIVGILAYTTVTTPNNAHTLIKQKIRQFIIHNIIIITMAIPLFYLSEVQLVAIFLLFIARLTFVSVAYTQCVQLVPVGIHTYRGPFRIATVYILGIMRRCFCFSGYTSMVRITPIDNTDIPTHLLLGVSLRCLCDFASSHSLQCSGAATSVYVEHIRQITKNSQISFAEYAINDIASDGKPSVGRANIFVSHAQSRPFEKLIEALMAFKSSEKPMFFWIDMMCIRQNDVSSDILNIGRVINTMRELVLVLDPWDRPVSLGRVWCLFEIAHTVTVTDNNYKPIESRTRRLLYNPNKVNPINRPRLSVTMAPSERYKLAIAARDTRRIVERSILRFDCRTSSASIDSDRRKIMAFISATFIPGYYGSELMAIWQNTTELERIFDESCVTGEADHTFILFNTIVRKALSQALSRLSHIDKDITEL